MYAREQLLDLEGLGDVVVGAHLEPGDLVEGLALGGEHDYGHFRGLAHLAAHLPPALAGEHDVEQHDVGLFGEGEVYALLPVAGDEHVESVFLKIEAEQLGDIGVVFNDESFFVVLHIHQPFSTVVMLEPFDVIIRQKRLPRKKTLYFNYICAPRDIVNKV